MNTDTRLIEGEFKFSVNPTQIAFFNPVAELNLKGLNPKKDIIVKKTIQLAGILGKCFDYFYAAYNSHQWVKINLKEKTCSDITAVWIKKDDLDEVESITKRNLLPPPHKLSKTFSTVKSGVNFKYCSEIHKQKQKIAKVNAFLEKYKILEKYHDFDQQPNNTIIFFKQTQRQKRPLCSYHTKADLLEIWQTIALDINKRSYNINGRDYYVSFSKKNKIDKISILDLDTIKKIGEGTVCTVKKVKDLARGKWMVLRHGIDEGCDFSKCIENLTLLNKDVKSKGIQETPCLVDANFEGLGPTYLLQCWPGDAYDFPSDRLQLIPVLIDLADGFRRLGEKKIIHGDLRPENTMYKMNFVSEQLRTEQPRTDRLFFGDFDGSINVDKLTHDKVDFDFPFQVRYFSEDGTSFKDSQQADTLLNQLFSTKLDEDLELYKKFLLKYDVFSFGITLWSLLSDNLALFTKTISVQYHSKDVKFCDTNTLIEKSTFEDILKDQGLTDDLIEDFYNLITAMTAEDYLERPDHNEVYGKLKSIVEYFNKTYDIKFN